MMGDMNVVMNMEERIGSKVRMREIQPGRQRMETCELFDIPSGGKYYTWNSKQETETRVYSKLDRVMANDSWMDTYVKGNALFLPEGNFDHSPMILRVDNQEHGGKKPFKYFRMWTNTKDYKQRIKEAWNLNGQGTKMFCLTRKLKQVKHSLIDLNRKGFNAIQAEDVKAFQNLTAIQQEIQQDPYNTDLIQAEKEASLEYNQKHKIYMQYLK
ncbi:50S ribosomal protein L20 [Bienertia sinuspersici]